MGYAAVAAYERFRPEGLCLFNPDAELPGELCQSLPLDHLTNSSKSVNHK